MPIAKNIWDVETDKNSLEKCFLMTFMIWNRHILLQSKKRINVPPNEVK